MSHCVQTQWLTVGRELSPGSVERDPDTLARRLDARWDRTAERASLTAAVSGVELSAAPEETPAPETPEPQPAAPTPAKPTWRARIAGHTAKFVVSPTAIGAGAFAAVAAASAPKTHWLHHVVLGHPVSTWLSVAALAAGSWLAARVVRAVVERLLRRSKQDPVVKSFAVTASGYAVYGIAAASIANALGVDLPTLLGTLGVTSLAASFALKGPFGNLAGMISLVVDKPFRIGDKIQVGANKPFQGVVQSVELSRTRLRSDDGTIVDVPNSQFIDNAILKLAPAPDGGSLRPAKPASRAPWWGWAASVSAPAAWLTFRLWKGTVATSVGVMALMGAAWLTARAARWVTARLLKHSKKDPMLKSLIVSAAGLVVYLAYGVAIAHLLGVNLVGLMGSLSVTSMAVGYILRGPLTNIVGGLTILSREPRSFSLGDSIQVGSDPGVTGKVEQIGLSRTVLKNGDTSLLVPNLVFVETPVLKKP